MEDLYNLIPGALQGFSRSLISYPFEVIKTHMQINNTNTMETIKYFLKNDKMKFYRGIAIPLTQITFERSLQFYIYEKTKENNSTVVNSFLTSFITNTIFAPISILQVNIMTSDKDRFKNLTNFLKNSEKKKIFSKGISLEISKNYFSTFSYFYIYSTLQKKLNFENYYCKTFFSGVLSSIGVWIVVLPFDTIKVKYQTSNNSLVNIIKSTHNYRNLWKGLVPIIIRSFPSAGLGMVVYEYSKIKLNLAK
jgi:hypothetical protein